MMDLRRTFALPLSRIAACLLAFAWGSGVASAQSLGELAKREEARRAAIKSSGKIYTNDNVRSEPAARGAAPAPAPAAAPSSSAPATPPSPSGVAPPAAAAAGTEKPADGATKPDAGATPTTPVDPKKDQAEWRQRVQASRDSLSRAETFAEALQSRINALSNDFASRDDPAQRARVATDRQKALAELDRVKQEIQQHTKAIAGIQEEARKAGVPPGWVR